MKNNVKAIICSGLGFVFGTIASLAVTSLLKARKQYTDEYLANLYNTGPAKGSNILRSAEDLKIGNLSFKNGIRYSIWNGTSSKDDSRMIFFDVSEYRILTFKAISDTDAVVLTYGFDENLIDEFEIKANTITERIVDISKFTEVGFAANSVSPGASGNLIILEPAVK